MTVRVVPRLVLPFFVAALVVAAPVLSGEIRGEIRSIDRNLSHMVVHVEETKNDVDVNMAALTTEAARVGRKLDVKALKPGARVVVRVGVMASAISIDHEPSADGGAQHSILKEFWHNFTHNLFKPLLLFFYLGFLIPILRVEFEFPYVIYQGLTMYLLLAIGWHGGEELARLQLGSVAPIVGFMGVGFLTNFLIGIAAYLILKVACPQMRRIDQATVAGYYGSDSAGTFVTCLGVLATVRIAYDAYMPVMLAVMEIPGCLVALYLVSRLRHLGMDAQGTMRDEPGYDPHARPVSAMAVEHGQHPTTKLGRQVEEELEMSLEKREDPGNGGDGNNIGNGRKTRSLVNAKLLHEVFLNPGLYLLFGGILIGLISGLQGAQVTREDDNFFVALFQGVLCLFLLEMGMTASRKLRDLKSGGPAFIAFGLIAPNIFATVGILVTHTYAWLTGTHFQPGSYVLFAVLCAAASYIAVPAVQRLAIPEASPTLPLASSLGLTFSYNVTMGIPIYLEVAKVVQRTFPLA